MIPHAGIPIILSCIKDSTKTFTEISALQKRAASVLKELDENQGIGFFFEKQENTNASIKVRIYSEKDGKYTYLDQITENPKEYEEKIIEKFVLQKNIDSLTIKANADFASLADFFSGKITKPTGILFNKIIYIDDKSCTDLFDEIMSMFQRGKDKLKILNSLSAEKLTKNDFRKNYAHIKSLLDEIFAKCNLITYLIFYDLRKARADPTGIFVFIDDDIDIANKILYSKENAGIIFYSNFINNKILKDGQQINSITLYDGVSVKELLCFVTEICTHSEFATNANSKIELNSLKINAVHQGFSGEKQYKETIANKKELNDLKSKYRLLKKDLEITQSNLNSVKGKNKYLEDELETLQESALENTKKDFEEQLNDVENLNLSTIAKMQNMTVENVINCLSQEQIEQIFCGENNDLKETIIQQSGKVIDTYEQNLKFNKSNQHFKSCNISQPKSALDNWSSHFFDKFLIEKNIDKYYKINYKHIKSRLFTKIICCPFLRAISSNEWLISLFELENKGNQSFFQILDIINLLEFFLDKEPEVILRKLQDKIFVKKALGDFPVFSATVGKLNINNHSLKYARAGMPYLYYNKSFLKRDKGYPKLGFQWPDKLMFGVINFEVGDNVIWQSNSFYNLYGRQDPYPAKIINNSPYDLFLFCLERQKND